MLQIGFICGDDVCKALLVIKSGHNMERPRSSPTQKESRRKGLGAWIILDLFTRGEHGNDIRSANATLQHSLKSMALPFDTMSENGVPQFGDIQAT
jgi:hypothetical protein